MARVIKEYNPAVINPALAKEWHPTRNRNLIPHDVTTNSDKKVWWLCERGHEWKAIISNRSKGYDCPHCGYLRSRRKTISYCMEPGLARVSRVSSLPRDLMRS
jgi:hypothetical protein